MKPGLRLSSTTCDTTVVVVKPAEVELHCGGQPMAETAGDLSPPAAGFDGGTLLGKRYADATSGLEVLCVKGGAGSLSVDGRVLDVLQAKKLPASD